MAVGPEQGGGGKGEIAVPPHLENLDPESCALWQSAKTTDASRVQPSVDLMLSALEKSHMCFGKKLTLLIIGPLTPVAALLEAGQGKYVQMFQNGVGLVGIQGQCHI